MYSLLRDVLFKFDAESVHHFSMKAMKTACAIEPVRKLIADQYQFKSSALYKQAFGLPFENPVGLGAGFDKNALYIKELETLGFGFIEVGTVTPKPQPGNDRPRLFRLPKDQAIINRMGFNNDGVEEVAKRLRETKRKMIIGGNIGKNKMTSNEDAYKDYEKCMTALFNCVDYFVVNVSSPNTPGLRQLQEKSSLKKILSSLQEINQGRINTKPLLLKIAPDLTVGQLDDIIELANEVELSGIVATNTTIDRSAFTSDITKVESIGAGGVSGRPLKKRSTEIVQYISRNTSGKLPIIASGGIFTGADASEKIHAGASLLQVWTGFIYRGPAIVKEICNALATQTKA